ncbi:unnamed protein product [Cylicocyclus nassatus]|uniref:Uncharacterized protein n=1 Tax=Cylicocyclus nassatus TaxID=53992 RepID=A0AA36DMX1_CYLNA|nr:unnamed protein product [Cylicocyclus nassatus]
MGIINLTSKSSEVWRYKQINVLDENMRLEHGEEQRATCDNLSNILMLVALHVEEDHQSTVLLQICRSNFLISRIIAHTVLSTK